MPRAGRRQALQRGQQVAQGRCEPQWPHDGRHTASADRTARLWEVTTAQSRGQSPAGHTDA